MQGHVRRRGRDSWTVVVNLDRDPITGKRRQLWRSVKGTKREAEALLVQLLHQRDTGVEQLPGRLTVGEYLERWLEDYARINTAPRTFETYQGIVHTHLVPALGSVALSKLRPQHIQNYYSRALTVRGTVSTKRLSNRSVLHHHRVLREALGHAVRWQILARNPADAVEPPRVQRQELPVPSSDALDRLLSEAQSTPFFALIHLALMTGLRQGELLGLRWTDVDLEQRMLAVNQTLQWIKGTGFTFQPPKTHRSRRPVVLSENTLQILRQHRQRQLEERLKLGPDYHDFRLVFCQADGGPLDPSNFRRAWRRILKDANVGHVRFHDLRHAHATQLLMAGIHPKVVSERLGHSSISMTMDTYSHVLPALQAEAVEQLDRWLADRRTI
jgi:integrase